MKIKRMFAADMRGAIRKVREELGPDAVILSNSQVEGGIEIVAAIDYDESLLLGDSLTKASVSAAPAATNAPVEKAKPTGMRAAASGRVEQPAQRREPVVPPVTNERTAKIEWVQDPALVEMRGELKSLRALLEQQLSGLAWGDMARRNPVKAKLIRSLTELDLHPELVRTIADGVADFSDFQTAWRQALGQLSHQLRVANELMERGGVFALVGGTGVGKTTTAAKLAARYALSHGRNRVAFISTDNFRIGAHDQLRTYGRILDLPVRIAGTRDELREAIRAFSDKDLVLIDTAGMSQRDLRLSEQFSMLGDVSPQLKTILVASAATHRAGIDEVIQAFHRTRLDACIVTKLDETTSLGGTVSSLITQQLPVAFVSDGQRVPEDIQPARAHALISRSVALVQQNGSGIEDEKVELTYDRMMANAHG